MRNLFLLFYDSEGTFVGVLVSSYLSVLPASRLKLIVKIQKRYGIDAIFELVGFVNFAQVGVYLLNEFRGAQNGIVISILILSHNLSPRIDLECIALFYWFTLASHLSPSDGTAC